MTEYIYTLNEIKEIVEPVARAYGVSRLSLFGSYARGSAQQNSDIDIRIIDSGDIRGLIKLAGFNRELEERFGLKVDVVVCDSSASDQQLLTSQNLVFRWTVYIALLFIIVVFSCCGPGYDSAAFIYSGF